MAWAPAGRSDFFADGGEHLLPPSRGDVVENVAGIEAFLALQTETDVVLIEDRARVDVELWIDLRARVDRVFREALTRSSIPISKPASRRGRCTFRTAKRSIPVA